MARPRRHALVLVILLLASALPGRLFADPMVLDGTIFWEDEGWVQVQSTEDFRTLCQGVNSCDVPPGTYHVINHTTKQRFENIVVGDSAITGLAATNPDTETGNDSSGIIRLSDNVFLDGNRIFWTDSGWYQVQRRDTFANVCQGGSSCTVTPGVYIVINHNTETRLNNVAVTATGSINTPVIGNTDQINTGSTSGGGSPSDQVDASNPAVHFEINGSTITFLRDQWFQVQRADNYANVCQGQPSCTLEPGTYNVINHDTQQRFDGVTVGDASAGIVTTDPSNTNSPSAPQAPGGAIVLPNAGSPATGPIYQINAADPFNRNLENARGPLPVDGRPSQPQNLRVELIANDWVEFNWAPSTDGGSIVAYNIYRDETIEPLYVIERGQTHPNSGIAAELQKYWDTTSFMDCNRTRFYDVVYFCNGGPNGEPARGPQSGARHVYYVSAVDNDGNESDLSAPLEVQLYANSGAPLQDYRDPHLISTNAFPFRSELARSADYLDNFQLVFSDEFNGGALDTSKWNTRLLWGPNVVINGEQQYFVDTQNDADFGYNPFSFTGTSLKITAQQTPLTLSAAANNQPYLSGALSSHDKFGFTYGYVESRMKVSGIFGALSTFYLYHRFPGDHGPEIDIMEFLGYNQFGDEDAFQTYHYRDAEYADNGIIRSSPTMTQRNNTGARYSDDFHTYGVLWEPGLVVWYIDGVEIKRLHGPQISRRQMNLVTYLVTGSVWAPTPNQYSVSDDAVERRTDDVVDLPFQLEADGLPIELEIDYVRVYQQPGR